MTISNKIKNHIDILSLSLFEMLDFCRIQFYENYFSALTNLQMQTYAFQSFRVPQRSSQILTFSEILF